MNQAKDWQHTPNHRSNKAPLTQPPPMWLNSQAPEPRLQVSPVHGFISLQSLLDLHLNSVGRFDGAILDVGLDDGTVDVDGLNDGEGVGMEEGLLLADGAGDELGWVEGASQYV